MKHEEETQQASAVESSQHRWQPSVEEDATCVGFLDLPDPMLACILRLLPLPDLYSCFCVCHKLRDAVIQACQADVAVGPSNLAAALASRRKVLLRPGQYCCDLLVEGSSVELFGLGRRDRVQLLGHVSCREDSQLTLWNIAIRGDLPRDGRALHVVGHNRFLGVETEPEDDHLARAFFPAAVSVHSPLARAILSYCDIVFGPSGSSSAIEATGGAVAVVTATTISDFSSPVRALGPGSTVRIMACTIKGCAQRRVPMIGMYGFDGAEVDARGTSFPPCYVAAVKVDRARVVLVANQIAAGMQRAVQGTDSELHLEGNTIRTVNYEAVYILGNSDRVRAVVLRNRIESVFTSCVRMNARTFGHVWVEGNTFRYTQGFNAITDLVPGPNVLVRENESEQMAPTYVPEGWVVLSGSSSDSDSDSDSVSDSDLNA